MADQQPNPGVRGRPPTRDPTINTPHPSYASNIILTADGHDPDHGHGYEEEHGHPEHHDLVYQEHDDDSYFYRCLEGYGLLPYDDHDEGEHEDPEEHDDSYFDSFPPGYKFEPYDHEFVNYYLVPKIEKKKLPPNRINDVELYQHNPDDLAEKHKSVLGKREREWYFFTPRERKYKNGERPSRKAGDGYWKATGAKQHITFNEETIGYKQALVYYKGNPPKGDKTLWIMHEFRVNKPKKPRKNPDDMQLDEWVLCKMYKQKPRKSKAKNGEDQNDDGHNEDDDLNEDDDHSDGDLLVDDHVDDHVDDESTKASPEQNPGNAHESVKTSTEDNLVALVSRTADFSRVQLLEISAAPHHDHSQTQTLPCNEQGPMDGNMSNTSDLHQNQQETFMGFPEDVTEAFHMSDDPFGIGHADADESLNDLNDIFGNIP